MVLAATNRLTVSAGHDPETGARSRGVLRRRRATFLAPHPPRSACGGAGNYEMQGLGLIGNDDTPADSSVPRVRAPIEHAQLPTIPQREIQGLRLSAAPPPPACLSSSRTLRQHKRGRGPPLVWAGVHSATTTCAVVAGLGACICPPSHEHTPPAVNWDTGRRHKRRDGVRLLPHFHPYPRSTRTAIGRNSAHVRLAQHRRKPSR